MLQLGIVMQYSTYIAVCFAAVWLDYDAVRRRMTPTYAALLISAPTVRRRRR